MRCIEMEDVNFVGLEIVKINRNMRCIEINYQRRWTLDPNRLIET